MIHVRQVFERDTEGNPARFVVLASEATYTEASAKRRANGVRLAAYHSMPIDLELWEELPNLSGDGATEGSVWVYINTLTTEVVFTMSEETDHDDTLSSDD